MPATGKERRRSRAHSWVATVTLVAASAAIVTTRAAYADRRPTVASDAFYAGVRIDPGFAMVGGWDLDVYLTRARGVSVGPGVSIAVLGSAVPNGRQQDFLLAVDFARLKIGASSAGGEWRPFAMLGGGFSFARLPEYVSRGVTVSVPSMTGATSVTGDLMYPRLEEFAPMLTIGAGVDLFANAPIGGTLMFATHFHVSGTSRMPDAWFEITSGIRFGL